MPCSCMMLRPVARSLQRPFTFVENQYIGLWKGTARANALLREVTPGRLRAQQQTGVNAPPTLS